MSLNSLLRLVFTFLFLIALQVLLVRTFVLFHVGFCFVYVGAIFFLPQKTNRMIYIVIAFSLGILMDMFYDSIGIHAAAMTWVAFLRQPIYDLLTPKGSVSENSWISISNMGWRWMILYVSILCFAHHIFLFYIDAGFNNFFFSLLKIIFSTFLSSLAILWIAKISDQKGSENA